MRNFALLIAFATLLAFASFNASAADGTSIGQTAPAFSAQDQNGKVVQLSDFAGKTIVLEWLNPDCPYAQRHAKEKTMQTLADKYKDKDVVWIGINTSRDTTNQINAAWVKDNNLTYPVLNDAASSIAKAYGAKATPHMFIIDKTGKLVYKGAIDNDRDGEKTTDKVNYVAKALDEVLAGKPVSLPETTAYGCSVKYR
jgi:peroxiredoxin